MAAQVRQALRPAHLTGKDILTETVFTGMTLSRNGLPIPNYEHRRMLRRYQVWTRTAGAWTSGIGLITSGNRSTSTASCSSLSIPAVRATATASPVRPLQYRLLKAPEPDEDASMLGKTSIRPKALMDAGDWWHYYDRRPAAAITSPVPGRTRLAPVISGRRSPPLAAASLLRRNPARIWPGVCAGNSASPPDCVRKTRPASAGSAHFMRRNLRCKFHAQRRKIPWKLCSISFCT